MPIIIDGTGTISGVSATGLTTAQTVSASNVTTGTLPYAQLPTGSVLQVVNASSTTNVTTTSTSLVTTGFSATITPKFSNSKVIALVNISSYNATAGAYHQYALFRGATNITSTATGYCAYSTGAVAVIIPNSDWFNLNSTPSLARIPALIPKESEVTKSAKQLA
jgi:hypothetical protein